MLFIMATETMTNNPPPGEEGRPCLEEIRDKVSQRLSNAKYRRRWFWIEDEESVVQEVLLRFADHERSGKFVWRDEDSLWAYLMRTMFFVVMELKDKGGLDTVPLDEKRDFRLSRFRHNLSDDFARNDCLQRLYDTIDSLKESYRQLLELTLAGLKTGAIAEIVEKSPSRVAVTKFRALQSLRTALTKSEWLEECGDEFSLEVTS